MWIGLTLIVVAGAVTLAVAARRHGRRPERLGSVSQRWIAEHRADW